MGPEALNWTDRPADEEPRCGLGLVMSGLVWRDLNEPRP